MSFKSRLSTISKSLRGPNRDEMVHEYLNQSVSFYDLERRQREIEQGKFRGI